MFIYLDCPVWARWPILVFLLILCPLLIFYTIFYFFGLQDIIVNWWEKRKRKSNAGNHENK
jgi:hypothetical protein